MTEFEINKKEEIMNWKLVGDNISVFEYDEFPKTPLWKILKLLREMIRTY